MNEESPDPSDPLAHRSDGDTFRVEFPEGDDEPSTTIVKAVAAVAGCTQDELDPLYYVVEPDALDSIFQSTVRGDHEGDVEVSFTYHGFDVSVHSYGIVEIEPRDGDVIPDDVE